ncbi:MAG: AraC-like DNA-binding protein [Planctomycetota bacterium]|jgi:AraC-like DNA-binding protein
MDPSQQPASTTSRPLPHNFRAWGICVLESHHAEEFRMELTTQTFLKIILVVQGKGALHTGSRSWDCEEGDIIVVPIGQEHRIEDRVGYPMSLYVVSILPNVLEVAALNPSFLPAGVLTRNRLVSAQTEATMRQLLFEQTLEQPQSGAMVIGLTLRLLAVLVRTYGHYHDQERIVEFQPQPTTDSRARVQAYIEHLEQRFFEARDLDTAAKELGLSRRRFTQLFRSLTETSWLAYVRRLRITHAKRLLRQTHRTIASIAFECGFEDLSTFYRAFKREVGTSPSQWRQNEAAVRTPQS